ncbi:MAG TPA: hypothetical protein VGM01_08015, partial [Ktedonobacteraceae bacterium]
MAEVIKEAPVTSGPAETTSSPFVALKQWSKTIWGRWTIRVLFYVLLVAIWQVLFNSNIWQDFILPSPLEVSNSMLMGFTSNFYLQSILSSLSRLGIGYAISLVFGLILGLLIGRFNLLKETVGSLILGLQGLPSICWLPLAVLWFGLNDQAI